MIIVIMLLTMQKTNDTNDNHTNDIKNDNFS